MATSAELYQLSWVIEQLLADPRRIVQARSHLHLGQQVQYFNWDDGKQRAARVVSVKHPRVTVQDEASGRHVSLPYAAISVEVAATANAGDTAHEASELAPPPEVGRREDFRVGQRVSFIDRDLQHRIGLIVRINQQTATLDCDGQSWRVEVLGEQLDCHGAPGFGSPHVLGNCQLPVQLTNALHVLTDIAEAPEKLRPIAQPFDVGRVRCTEHQHDGPLRVGRA